MTLNHAGVKSIPVERKFTTEDEKIMHKLGLWEKLPEGGPLNDQRVERLEWKISQLEKKVTDLSNAIYDLKMCGDVSEPVFDGVLECVDREV